MFAFLFTFTAITLLVLAAYSIEQLGNTYTYEVKQRQLELDKLDSYLPNS